MTLVIPQDYAEVVQSLILSGDAEPMAVTYAVGIDSGAPPASASSLAADLRSAFVTAFSAFFNPLFTISQCEVRWQDTAPPAPPQIGVGPGSTIATGSAGTLLPQNSAFLVHKRTSVAGRGGRGRMYFPGVYESQANNIGQVDPAAVSAFNTSLASFLAAVPGVTGVINMVVLHDSLGAFAGAPPAIITALDCDPVIATQRRRLRR